MAETLQQTQTLSLRISEALRKRLEDIRSNALLPIVLRRTAHLAAVGLAAAALVASGATFHTIASLNQTGTPIGLLEYTPDVFYSWGTNSPDWVFSITPQGARAYIASFAGNLNAGGPLVAGSNGRFYSEVYYPSSTDTSVFSVETAAGTKQVYPAQSVSPALLQSLPDGHLLAVSGGPLGASYLATVDLQGVVSNLYQFPVGETPLLLAVYASDGNYYGVSVLPDGSAYVYRATPSGSRHQDLHLCDQHFQPEFSVVAHPGKRWQFVRHDVQRRKRPRLDLQAHARRPIHTALQPVRITLPVCGA